MRYISWARALTHKNTRSFPAVALSKQAEVERLYTFVSGYLAVSSTRRYAEPPTQNCSFPVISSNIWAFLMLLRYTKHNSSIKSTKFQSFILIKRGKEAAVTGQWSHRNQQTNSQKRALDVLPYILCEVLDVFRIRNVITCRWGLI